MARGDRRIFLVCSPDGDVLPGVSDPGLNDSGLNRAIKIAQRFKGETVKIATLCASPLLRSVQTADSLHDFLRTKVRILAGLKEGPVQARNENETEKMFVERVTLAWKFIKDLPRPVLVVCHPGVLRRLISLLNLTVTESEIQALLQTPTAWSLESMDDQKWTYRSL